MESFLRCRMIGLVKIFRADTVLVEKSIFSLFFLVCSILNIEFFSASIGIDS
jgi:hypothetical protein